MNAAPSAPSAPFNSPTDNMFSPCSQKLMCKKKGPRGLFHARKLNFDKCEDPKSQLAKNKENADVTASKPTE